MDIKDLKSDRFEFKFKLPKLLSLKMYDIR